MSTPVYIDPLPGFTGYLTMLATRLGFETTLEELDPVCGHHPELVTAWFEAGTQHAAMAHMQLLLRGPETFMREQVTNGTAETARMYVTLLAHLYEHENHLAETVRHAGTRFREACTALAGTGLGFITPTATTTTPPDPPDNPPHRPTPQVRRLSVGQASVELATGKDGEHQLSAHGTGVPPWQASFSPSTPSRVIDAALAAALAPFTATT